MSKTADLFLAITEKISEIKHEVWKLQQENEDVISQRDASDEKILELEEKLKTKNKHEKDN